MSYDLFFCREKGKPLAFEEVVAWAEGREHFKRSGETQLWYENPETGVYFSLEHEFLEMDPGDPPTIPVEYEDIGLAFNLNFIRPSFFAYEAMPIVEELGKALALLVVADDLPPKPCDSGQLIASWCDNNQRACEAMAKDGEIPIPPHMPPEKSLKFWRYMRGLKELEAKLEAEGYFVPQLLVVRAPGASVVTTAIAWKAGIFMIVPECDWVVAVRERMGFFGRKEEMCVVSTKSLMEAVGSYLEEYDPANGLRILKPDKVAAVAKVFGGLDLRPDWKQFTRIGPDGFVDVKLEGIQVQ